LTRIGGPVGASPSAGRLDKWNPMKSGAKKIIGKLGVVSKPVAIEDETDWRILIRTTNQGWEDDPNRDEARAYSPRRAYPTGLALNKSRSKPDAGSLLPAHVKGKLGVHLTAENGAEKKTEGGAADLKMQKGVFRLLPPAAQKDLSIKLFKQKELNETDPAPWEAGGCGVHTALEPSSKRHIQFDRFLKASALDVSPDLTSVSCRKKTYGGWIMSEKPIKRRAYGRFFEVQIEEVNAARWPDGLGIGVALNLKEDSTPSEEKGAFEGFAYEMLPDSWLLGYDGRCKFKGISTYLKGKEVRNPWQDPKLPIWRPRDLRGGDRVGFLCTHEGALMLFVNEDLRYFVRETTIDAKDKVHAVVDLDGCTVSLHLLDAPPSNKVLQQVAQALAEDKDNRIIPMPKADPEVYDACYPHADWREHTLAQLRGVN